VKYRFVDHSEKPEALKAVRCTTIIATFSQAPSKLLTV